MGSKISNTEWGLVIGFILTIEAVQALLDFFFIGPFVNPFITTFLLGAFPFYLKLRGVKFDKEIAGIIAGGLVIKLIPFVDALPIVTGLAIRTMIKDNVNKKLKKPNTTSSQPEGGNQQPIETQKKAA